VLAAQQALSRQQQALAAQTESLAAQLAAQVSEWQQLSTTLQEKMRALDGLHHSALEPRVDEIESALEAIREQLGPLKDFTWNVVVQNLLKSAVLEEANLNRLHTTPLLSAEAIGLLDTLAQKALPDNSKASADAWWWRVVPLRKK
jgi:DNA repair exonuclease SbcCD ATPase subunit